MPAVFKNWMRLLALAGLIAGSGLGLAPVQAQSETPPPAVAPEVAPAGPEEEPPLRDLTTPAVEQADEATPAAEAPPAVTPAASRREGAAGAIPWRRRVAEKVNIGGSTRVAADESTSEAVAIGGSNHIEGEVRGEAVAVLGDITVERGARVGREAVAVLGDTRILGEVGGESVTVLGDAEIDARVGGQVVVVGGQLTLGPSAEIEGGIVLVGGQLERDPAARVAGGVEQIVPLDLLPWEGLRAFFKKCVVLGRPLAVDPHLGWLWMIAGFHLLLYVVIAALFPRGVVRCAEVMEERPGSTVIAALLTAIALPLVTVLLAATGIGLIVVPFIALGTLIGGLFGRAAVHAWLGRRLAFMVPGVATAAVPVIPVLLGGVIITLIYLVPFLGLLMWKLFGLLGLGMVIYTLILTNRREREIAAKALAAAAPPASMAPTAGPTPTVSPGCGAGVTAASSAGFVAPVAVASFDVVPPTGPLPPATDPAGAPGADPGGAGAVAPEPPRVVPPRIPPAATRVVDAAGMASTLPRATFGVRFGALVIDVVLVAIVGSFFSAILPGDADSVPLLLGVYCFVLWALRGTTVGGIICGLKVVRLDDRPVDWPVSLVRTLGAYLSVACLGLGFLWILFDDQQQTWHDKIAGTIVVRLPRGASLI